MDSVTVKLGYVTNSGFTKKQNHHNVTEDDQFTIKVEIQMSDHLLTNDLLWNNVYFAVKYGDIIVVGK